MTRWGAPTCSLWNLLVLLLAASLLPVRDATPEGDTLFTLMQKWSVSLDGWGAGGDPCAQNWTSTRCRNGNVVYLNMTNIGISGLLPPEIGDLSYLEVLDLSNVYNKENVKNNSLTGEFPNTFARLTRLKSFNASNIPWSIEFPKVLTKLTTLEELYFSAGRLTGSFPDEFFSNLVNLRYLFIGDNKLSGSLHKFAVLKKLILLTMFKNDFTGVIPGELADIPNLEYFNCHTCGLYGPLPEAWSKFEKLRNLTLHRNNLTGPIPTSWKGMKAMRNFRMDQNYLSGDFPAWMFNEFPDLNFLQLGKNSFSGPNPDMKDLELKHNVSYTYFILKWECNYMNGLMPCGEQGCSNHTQGRIDDKGTPFVFDKNCYSDSSYKDLGPVSTDCDRYHPSDVTCPDFYSALSLGQCPRCPSNQVPWPGEGRQCVCQLSRSDGRSGVPVGAVVGGVLGLVVVFSVILALILYKRRKHFSFLDYFTVKRSRGVPADTCRVPVQSSDNAYAEYHKSFLNIGYRYPLEFNRECRSDEYWEVPPGVQKFTAQDLAKVTQDFSDNNMIGQGGFGKVFVGTLEDGRMVAIKRASAGGLQGTFEFHNEVTVLSRLHHRHLVKLEGFCDEDDLQILVYEFMKKGNLHAHLLGKITTTPLHWYRRLEIAYGVAQGLEYLHSFANPPVIHRDVKPSNILLDDNMVAKLADFGISKVSPAYDTHVSTRPAGTAGYLDPDYFMRRQLTTASDVYAYGVVMLELVTGQEAIDHMRLEEFNLIEWVRKRFKTAGIVSIVDPLIEHDYSVEAFTEMAQLGLQCASFDRNERPTMKVVLATLEPLMIMQNLYPVEDKVKDGKKNRGVHIAFDSEYLAQSSLVDVDKNNEYPVPTSLLDHTTEYPVPKSVIDRRNLDRDRSIPSEVGPNVQLMDKALRPR